MAPTVIFWQSPITLTGPQRTALGAYATAAFPAAIPAKMTNLSISRVGPQEGVRAVLWEEGTITATQFLNLQQQGQNVSIIPGTVSGSNVDAIRRTDGNGTVPPQEDPEDPPGDLTQLRALVQSIFGVSATDAQNLHGVSFSRALGEVDVTAQLYWRRTVTAQEWVDGISAGECATTLYPHEIDE